MKIITLPNIGDPPEVQADWLEWSALREGTSFVSWSTYQSNLLQAGSQDALDIGEDQEQDDLLEDFINEVDRELTSRQAACGGDAGPYPYEMTHEGVAYTGNEKGLTYRFLLLLSLFGKDAGPAGSHPERLFEDLSSLALHEYLGGTSAGLNRALFGFPRRILPEHFPTAVDDLCKRLGQGKGAHGHKPEVDQKDAKLDLVAWRAFPDGRIGKLIGFGQCATGDNWTEKVSELRPSKWCRLWMKDSSAIDPFSSLFIPHRPNEEKWLVAANYAGVLFDRCRIAWLVPSLPDDLAKDVRKWVEHVEKADLSGTVGNQRQRASRKMMKKAAKSIKTN
jgi:hypothetical protein